MSGQSLDIKVSYNSRPINVTKQDPPLFLIWSQNSSGPSFSIVTISFMNENGCMLQGRSTMLKITL